MKAIVCSKYGAPDVLELKEIAKPSPKDNEVLIKVHAASVNPLDWHFMRGTPKLMRTTMGLFKPKFSILGADVAGIVEAVGKDVKQFKVGDEVFGELYKSGMGSLAEYACGIEEILAKKPVNMTFEEAASVPVAALTALQGLRDHGKIKQGHEVLINGASGGVGTFAVQIAKSFGTIVTGVCSTRNLELVKSLGADYVIDYTKEDFTKGEKKYDLIVDNVGNHLIQDYKNVLKPSGICPIIGYQSNKKLINHMLKSSLKSKKEGQKAGVMPVMQTTQKDLLFLKDLIEEEKVKSVIDKTFPLEQTSDAIEHLETGHARGKVVIKVRN